MYDTNKFFCSRRWRSGVLVCIAVFSLVPTVGAQATTIAESQPMPEEVVERLNDLYDAIGARRTDIDRLEGLLASSEGRPEQGIYRFRLDRAWIGLLEDGDRFVQAVVDAQGANYALDEYIGLAVRVLGTHSNVATVAWRRMRGAIRVPEPGMSVAEQAAGYARLFDLQRMTDRIFDTYLAGLGLAEELGVDMADDIESIEDVLVQRALNVSVFLELSVDDVEGLKAGVAALPDDAELKAKLSIAETRVKEAAAALQRVVQQMESLGLDTADYREQILTATGAATADVFDIAVIGRLLSRWGRSMRDLVIDNGPNFILQTLLFLLIVFLFRKVANVVERLVRRALGASKVQLSLLLQRMITSTAGNAVFIVGILIGLSQLGISLGPLLAGLGIAGFVIGFALQDSLSNFASGMMILFYRPFDVGDVVEVGGVFGKVSAMSLVNTTVLTLDNQTIVMPNNMIWGGVIKNLNEQRHRRVDLTFGVSYSDDIPKVEKILHEIIDAHDKVLAEPEPTIRLHELGDSSVNFVVRPWVESEDYWNVYWDVMREVKMRFDAEGISIPFPQRDVHVYTDGVQTIPPPTDAVA